MSATKVLGFRKNSTVLIGICTCNRPVMLSRCLASLENLVIPEQFEIEVAIASNGPSNEHENRLATQKLAEQTRYTIHFNHDNQAGISKARNHILDIANDRRVDWLLFIDDDEVADPEWVAALLAKEYEETHVLTGLRSWIYPEIKPFWFLPPKPQKYSEGETLTYALTSNVRLSKEVIRSGLRFNERLRLMGGEDIEFFAEAHLRGFTIRQTLRAVTHEVRHPERMTYFSQLYRAYWGGASIVSRKMIEERPSKVIMSYALTVPFHLIVGWVELIFSPFFFVSGPNAFKVRALGGGKKISRALGRVAAILKLTPQPYKKTVGY